MIKYRMNKGGENGGIKEKKSKRMWSKGFYSKKKIHL